MTFDIYTINIVIFGMNVKSTQLNNLVAEAIPAKNLLYLVIL